MAYDLVYRWKKFRPDLFGKRCRLISRGSLNSALVEFEDGTKHACEEGDRAYAGEEWPNKAGRATPFRSRLNFISFIAPSRTPGAVSGDSATGEFDASLSAARLFLCQTPHL